MFRFENSSALYFLVLLPFIFAASRYAGKSVQKSLEKAFGQRVLPLLQASVSKEKRKWRQFLQLLAMMFAIVALARPQFGESSQEIKSLGLEMMILVDVSESMLVEDVRPSRLEFAKRELSRLLDLQAGSKFGLVAFAGSAALVSPITTDTAALKMFIDSLSPAVVSSQGTNFFRALTEAQESFDRGGIKGDEQSRAARVIVIASDGEDHEAGALAKAKEMLGQGVRIFTLAFGTEKGGAIPERDARGYLKGYKKDSSGQTILSTARGEALERLATDGGGSFYFASIGADNIRLLADDIDKLEKAEFESARAVQYEERYQIFLGLSILLFCIELFMSDRRREFRFWRGRFEVPKA